MKWYLENDYISINYKVFAHRTINKFQISNTFVFIVDWRKAEQKIVKLGRQGKKRLTFFFNPEKKHILHLDTILFTVVRLNIGKHSEQW